MHKYKVGRFIFFSNLILFALIFVYYIISGLTNNEFVEIMKLLAPIKAVYMTALIKYVIASKDKAIINTADINNKVNKLYRTVTSIMIYTHISSLIVIISLFALFNIIDFNSLKNTISFLEIFFGAYIGLIMSDMFKTEDSKEKKE